MTCSTISYLSVYSLALCPRGDYPEFNRATAWTRS